MLSSSLDENDLSLINVHPGLFLPDTSTGSRAKKPSSSAKSTPSLHTPSHPRRTIKLTEKARISLHDMIVPDDFDVRKNVSVSESKSIVASIPAEQLMIPQSIRTKVQTRLELAKQKRLSMPPICKHLVRKCSTLAKRFKSKQAQTTPAAAAALGKENIVVVVNNKDSPQPPSRVITRKSYIAQRRNSDVIVVSSSTEDEEADEESLSGGSCSFLRVDDEISFRTPSRTCTPELPSHDKDDDPPPLEVINRQIRSPNSTITASGRVARRSRRPAWLPSDQSSSGVDDDDTAYHDDENDEDFDPVEAETVPVSRSSSRSSRRSSRSEQRQSRIVVIDAD